MLCGGVVKVFVFSLGLMGLLLGSVVVNMVMMGMFMILLMCSLGFKLSVVVGVEVVVSLGGVLVLLVMGVGVYMMFEIVDLLVMYYEIVCVVIVLVVLYYFLFFFIVDL